MKNIGFILVLAMAISACGKGTATAKLSFSSSATALNHSNMQTTVTGAADSFRMKLIAAYVTEDINPTTQNNVGNTEMFYLNPECGDDITHCDTSLTVNGGKAEDGANWAHAVTTPFDFSNLSNVNTTLNSQGRSISASTYKYVRLEFCKYQPDTPNIFWTYAADGTGTEHSFAQSSCNVTAAIEPPLTVNDGDSLTINLAYSLVGSVVVSGGGGGSNCEAGNCFILPTFVPSVTR